MPTGSSRVAPRLTAMEAGRGGQLARAVTYDLLMETRRMTRELAAQRQLADQAEAGEWQDRLTLSGPG